MFLFLWFCPVFFAYLFGHYTYLAVHNIPNFQKANRSYLINVSNVSIELCFRCKKRVHCGHVFVPFDLFSSLQFLGSLHHITGMKSSFEVSANIIHVWKSNFDALCNLTICLWHNIGCFSSLNKVWSSLLSFFSMLPHLSFTLLYFVLLCKWIS